MGFLSSIGSSIVGSAKSFVGMGGGGSGNFATDIFNVYKQFTSGQSDTFTNNYSNQAPLKPQKITSIGNYQKLMKSANAIDMVPGYNKAFTDKVLSDDTFELGKELHYQTSIPDFGYDIWLNEKYMWQRNLYNFFGEPGYFYYKIFFKFDTNFGLFGGILNGNSVSTNGGLPETNMVFSHNGALKYLSSIKNEWNRSIMAQNRIDALVRFTRTLSYISTNAPWFFKSVKGLDKAGVPVIDEFGKEKSIEIECNVDSIDMRLSTMMDWYKFACYDDMYHYEVIPENLRKFDMLIMVFPSPIKELHMPVMNATKSLPFASTKKTMQNQDKLSSFINNKVNKFLKKEATQNNKQVETNGNNFSFKLYEFIGCEIDRESISSQMPGDINNETPFSLGKGNIKIKYDQCYQHTSNEFERMLFGSDGILYDYDQSITKSGTEYLGYNTSSRIQMMMPDDLTSVEGIAKHFGGMLAEYATNNISKFANKIMGKLLGNTWSNLTTLGYLTGNEDYIPGNSEKWRESVNRLTSKFEHKNTTLPYDSKNNFTNKYSKNREKWDQSLDNLNSNHDHTNTSIPYNSLDNLTINYSKYTEDMVQGLKNYVSTIFEHQDTRKPITENGSAYPYRTFKDGVSIYEMTDMFNFGNNSLENKRMNLADYWIFKQKQFTSGHDHNNTTNIYDPTTNLTVHYSQFADVWDKILKDLNSEHNHENTSEAYNPNQNLTNHYSKFANIWDKLLGDLDSKHDHTGTTQRYDSSVGLTNKISINSDIWNKMFDDLNSQNEHENTKEPYDSNQMLTNNISQNKAIWANIFNELNSDHQHEKTQKPYKK